MAGTICTGVAEPMPAGSVLVLPAAPVIIDAGGIVAIPGICGAELPAVAPVPAAALGAAVIDGLAGAPAPVAAPVEPPAPPAAGAVTDPGVVGAPPPFPFDPPSALEQPVVQPAEASAMRSAPPGRTIHPIVMATTFHPRADSRPESVTMERPLATLHSGSR